MLTRAVKYLSLIVAAVVLVSVAAFTACPGAEPSKIRMRVLCAGSLMLPFTELEEAFEAKYPDADMLIEGHGSIQVIRHVTELYEEADVVAVADHSLIPMMMYSVTVPDTDESYASWYVKFATNSLGFAYTPASSSASEINENNWYEVLARPDVKLGLSDARLDACGYRALMLLYLAESYYHDETIFENVLGPFNPPVEIQPGETATIIVPEVLRPVSERVVLRGSSIRTLALLESGDIDYAFEYQSVAEQHNLNFLELPPEINLSEAEYSEFYEQVNCKLDFQRFSSVKPEFSGQPIIYGITIPANAPYYDRAIKFLEFLLGPEGQQILGQNYQPPMVPFQADHIDKVPLELRQILEAG